MIDSFLERAKRGESVFICDVRDAFGSLGAAVECVVELAAGPPRRYIIPVPRPENAEESEFVKEFFYANIYNLISALGGKRIKINIKPGDDHIEKLCADLDDVFQTSVQRGNRTGYGKCLNVTDRVNAAMGCQDFCFEIAHTKRNVVLDNHDTPASDALPAFRAATSAARNATLCGLDIGGTDIKVVGTLAGRIKALKEYDWRPSDMTSIDELISPIMLITRVIRAALTLPDTGRGNELRATMLDKDATDEEMSRAVDAAEYEFGDLILLDGIGVNFPDVVIRNKIVGGETPKTQGIRRCSPDYESEFRRIAGLDEMLLSHCKPGGVVKIANDGSLAAYTAAVELAHSARADEVANGVFAHTLGTDLGSGWINENGEIPQIPLELYNCAIDLGNYPAREFDALDVRSIRNFNTGIAGTPQKSAGQSGAYRMALEFFKQDAPELFNELIDKGFIERNETGLYVTLTPQDMRKPLLEHIMELADNGQPQAEQVFREIGKYLAAIWRETEFILSPGVKRRVLFGRFVKRQNCFKLMQEGAIGMFGVTLDAGDDSLAYTPLMLDLKADPVYTVAQFGQAIGAAYFAAAELS
ncbi:MAG: hypothetical protein FWH57_01750 [Oscillospiraceae bacterium]|nr:hypothetical protein [Oscillospiraceae bacterium]